MILGFVNHSRKYPTAIKHRETVTTSVIQYKHDSFIFLLADWNRLHAIVIAFKTTSH